MDRTTTRRRPGRLKALLGAAALAVAALPAIAAAAPPNVQPGTAVVDGSPAEWTEADHFSDMHRAGDPTKVVESKLSMRYDCKYQVLYVKVHAVDGVTIVQNAADNFVKLGNSIKLVDGAAGNNGAPPDFEYFYDGNENAIGWEASMHLAPGTYANLNVHAQVNDGGSQTSAVPNRSIPIVLSCPMLIAEITAKTTYERAFTWAIAKSAAPTSVTTTADTTNVKYTVTATKSAPVDSDFRLTGTVTVDTQTELSLSQLEGLSLAVMRNGTEPCAVDPIAQTEFPIVVDYECTLPPGTTAADTGDVTAHFSANFTPVPLIEDEEPPPAMADLVAGASTGYAFGEPYRVVNDAADVFDAFNGGAPELIGDDITETRTFDYTRSLTVPASGCTDVPNIASVLPTVTPREGELAPFGTATATVKVCREVPPPVQPEGRPDATLRITKTGPARARAGTVMTYRITVRNTSATTAGSVVIRDILPSGYTLVGTVPGASLRAGRVTWTAAPLAPGASRTVVIRLRIARTASGIRCNNASASADNAGTVRARVCTRITRVAGAVVRVTG